MPRPPASDFPARLALDAGGVRPGAIDLAAGSNDAMHESLRAAAPVAAVEVRREAMHALRLDRAAEAPPVPLGSLSLKAEGGHLL